MASAGTGVFGSVGDLDDPGWQRTLDVNVTGAFRLVRAALPSLTERGGGSIVLISSTAAFVSGTENAAYETSKAAMIGLTRSLAVDYRPFGVRANALCPGWVVTPLGDYSLESLVEKWGITTADAYRHVTKHTPLQWPTTAEEVASCCLFLACDESTIVTGTALIADGGLMATPQPGRRGPNRHEVGQARAPTTGASGRRGPARRAELLHVLMLPDFERADRIGEFWSYPESRTFAELLIDCEEDRTLRAVLVGMLRESEGGS